MLVSQRDVARSDLIDHIVAMSDGDALIGLLSQCLLLRTVDLVVVVFADGGDRCILCLVVAPQRPTRREEFARPAGPLRGSEPSEWSYTGRVSVGG